MITRRLSSELVSSMYLRVTFLSKVMHLLHPIFWLQLLLKVAKLKSQVSEKVVFKVISNLLTH